VPEAGPVLVAVAVAVADAEPELTDAARLSNPFDLRDLTAQLRRKRFSGREIRTGATGKNTNCNILELVHADAHHIGSRTKLTRAGDEALWSARRRRDHLGESPGNSSDNKEGRCNHGDLAIKSEWVRGVHTETALLYGTYFMVDPSPALLQCIPFESLAIHV